MEKSARFRSSQPRTDRSIAGIACQSTESHHSNLFFSAGSGRQQIFSVQSLLSAVRSFCNPNPSIIRDYIPLPTFLTRSGLWVQTMNPSPPTGIFPECPQILNDLTEGSALRPITSKGGWWLFWIDTICRLRGEVSKCNDNLTPAVLAD